RQPQRRTLFPYTTLCRSNAASVARSVGAAAASAARVHETTVRSFLQRAGRPYDLVFTDPPYDLDDDAMDADLALLAPLLSPTALDRKSTRLNSSHVKISY